VKGLKIKRNEHVAPYIHDTTQILFAKTEHKCCDLVKTRGERDSKHGLPESEEASLQYSDTATVNSETARTEMLRQ
jgi:hypothetical protein